jgi:hemoglobin
MRHAGFHIASAERDAWLRCMNNAIDGLDLPDDLEKEMLAYIQMAANSLVNQPD